MDVVFWVVFWLGLAYGWLRLLRFITKDRRAGRASFSEDARRMWRHVDALLGGGHDDDGA